MTTILSDELYHFVGRSPNPMAHYANFELLKRILSLGCISHAPHNDDWGAVSYTLDLSKPLHFEELIVPTVTCFCDIPFASLASHTLKYGAFGLSLSRHHLIKSGARPVTYVPLRQDDWNNSVLSGSSLLSSLEATYRGLVSNLVPEGDDPKSLAPTRVPTTAAEAAQHLVRTLALNVLSFIKPYDSALDSSDSRYFYSERE